MKWRRLKRAPHVLVRLEAGPGDGSVRVLLRCEVCGDALEWGACRAPARRARAFAAMHPAAPHVP